MRKTRFLHVRVQPVVLEELDRLAERERANRSAIIRRLIEAEIYKYRCSPSGDGQHQSQGEKVVPPGGRPGGGG